MNKIQKILFIFLLFLNGSIALGQMKTKNLSFNTIDIKDGLSSYTIRKIIQDKYGFTWIATIDGLNKFDGKRFTVYNKNFPGKYALAGNDISDICEDKARDLIWVISSYSGLNAIDTKTGSVVLNAIADKAVFSNDWLRCLNICSGKIWIGTNDGIAIYDPEKKIFKTVEKISFKKTDEIKSYGIDLIFTDRFNRVWVFIANTGLVIYSGADCKVLYSYTLSDLGLHVMPYYQMFTGILSIDDNNLLLATHEGFRMINYNANSLRETTKDNSFFENFPRQSIVSLGKANDGQVWFATSNDIYTYNIQSNISVRVQPIINGTRANFSYFISSIFFDSKNYLWLGTGKEAFFSTNKQLKFSPTYQTPDFRIKIDNVYFIYPLTDSSVYVCGKNGLYFIDNYVFSLVDSSRHYWYINRIDNDRFFVSTSNGCFVLNDDKRIIPADQVFPELKILRHDIINSGAQFGDSLWVLGSENGQGVYFWNYKRHNIYTISTETKPLQLKNSIVNNIYKTSDNNLWILSDNSVAVLDFPKKELQNISWVNPADNKPYSIFFDVCEANNYYWLAAYGIGILKIDKRLNIKKVISGREKLFSTGVYSLTPANDSLLFATTNNGLYGFNVKTLSSKTYYETDGLSSSFNWVANKKNDIIYIGGDKGLTMIYPNIIQTNTEPPRLYVDNIKIETKHRSIDSSNLNFTEYTIPSDFTQTTISFSGINYSNPSRTSYAYRIKNIDNDWIELGTQNFVSLIPFSPGTYTFEVKAANEDGVWCEPKQLTLTFLPKWYQTWWFFMLVGLSVAALLYSFYRYRLMQIRKQHQIRKEIAGDLHDDIGATINSVKIFTHLAESSDERKKYFALIKEALTQASNGLRDMIWVLDDAGDTAGDLFKRLRSFANPVAEASGVKITFHIDDADASLTLNKTEKRNLLLISKEAINNSIKYADCQNIIVTFSKQRNKITLMIQDDGKGFADDAITPGNGLRNMRDRAHQVHYNIFIDSENGVGTNVTLVKK